MSTAEVEIRPGDPSQDDARDAFVLAHPRSTFFHRAGWRRVVQTVFGNRSQEMIAWANDEIVGVLPLMEAPGFFGGKSLISVPYGVYGGPLGSSPEVERLLLDHAIALAERERFALLELRYREDAGLDLPVSSLYSTFVCDLPDTPEEVLAKMPKKARAEARKARNKHGLELTRGTWYVEDLYRMFLLNKHGLGSPALPPRMFEHLVREFRPDAQVHLVLQERQPVAAVMSFVHRDTLVAYYSGTLPGADRSVSASNFMYMALQEWAVEQGFRRFDFGRSRADSGAFRFKVHQGFEPQPLHYCYHLVTARQVPSFTPSNPRTRVLQRAWKKMPLWLVRATSGPLSRYLP